MEQVERLVKMVLQACLAPRGSLVLRAARDLPEHLEKRDLVDHLECLDHRELKERWADQDQPGNLGRPALRVLLVHRVVRENKVKLDRQDPLGQRELPEVVVHQGQRAKSVMLEQQEHLERSARLEPLALPEVVV